MATGAMHRAMADDGTQIVGSVRGRGPNLVLVPGGPGDGESSFQALVPELEDRFTCFAMSTRGKGLSADHPDHSAARLAGDVRSFVTSIGEPVMLLGHSSGGTLALEAAATTEAVTSLALYEPAIFDQNDDESEARLAAAFTRASGLVERGRSREAAEIFFHEVALVNDEEAAALARGPVFDLAGANLGSVLKQIEQSGPPRLSDPELPSRLSLPVLIMVGTMSPPLYARAVATLSQQLSDATVVEIDGAGHLGPQLAAAKVAESVARFGGSLAIT